MSNEKSEDHNTTDEKRERKKLGLNVITYNLKRSVKTEAGERKIYQWAKWGCRKGSGF